MLEGGDESVFSTVRYNMLRLGWQQDHMCNKIICDLIHRDTLC